MTTKKRLKPASNKSHTKNYTRKIISQKRGLVNES